MASLFYSRGVGSCVLFLGWWWFHLMGSGEGMVPAMYVFGDSLADVGNNNHLETLLKANFPHNGIDYPGRKATGRFSNGKNSADFLAEKLGVPTSPPYLSIPSSSNRTDAFLHGVSFASGGAGILDSTNSGQCLTFNKQIDYYSTVYGALVQQLGSAPAQEHLSKSIFVFIIGSNDLLNYVKSSSSKNLKSTPQQFVDSLISSLRGQLKRIYNLGARKLAFIGTGPVGCCPSLRHQNKTKDCNVEADYLSVLYDRGVAALLQELKSQLGDMSYSFFDTSSALLEYIQKPAAYGFSEVKAACCGLGDLNAKIACIPISTYCSNRKDHIFWDFYHPTETTAGLLLSTAFDGTQPLVYPINIRQLSAL
ncbi:GDSL esterase/lipase At5g55050-like [Phoenix dactylifera]|uniref:GDSL esterase/lipase At5g55050-like n=1 Tax=Phoenix dactylifera TaxID=42345 RepID=A0A8B7CRA0_PHODC|nr:GDSL esterase/lipase At5g55050-like [Phoenix dactylifera]